MLELKELYKTFNPGTINAKTALSGLSVTLNDGDFVTVIGGNGAGKSTMLNATAGTFFVDSGKVLIDGADVTNLPEHKRAAFIGRVFQDPMMGTAPSMQIEENLALAARRGQRRGLSWGVTKEEREQYRELLGGLGLGLESRLATKVSTLSGGQRQALTLLMATLKRPKLLLLDEHTAALDPKTAAKVMELTDRIVREGQLTTMMPFSTATASSCCTRGTSFSTLRARKRKISPCPTFLSSSPRQAAMNLPTTARSSPERLCFLPPTKCQKSLNKCSGSFLVVFSLRAARPLRYRHRRYRDRSSPATAV